MNPLDRNRSWIPRFDGLSVPGWNRPGIGIQLGDSHVALLESRHTKQGIQFPRAETESIDRPDNDEYRSALRTLVERVGIRPGTRVCLAVPTSDVILRSVWFPELSGHRLREAVQYEAEADLPFGADELVYDYVRDPVGTREGECRILIVLARDRAIQDRVEVLRSGDLVPERVDVSALCLFRFWCQSRVRDAESYKLENQTELLVYVQDRSLELVFYEDDRMLYARSLNRDPDKPTEFQAGPVPREDPGRWAGVSRVEFSRTFEHVREKLEGDPPQRVWVLGDVKLGGSIRDALGRYVDVPTKVVNPGTFPGPPGDRNSTQFLVARGLVQPQPSTGKEFCGVNLVPATLRQRREERRRHRQWITLIVLSGLVLLQLLVGFGWTYQRRQDQLENLRRRHNSIASLAERVRSFRERRRALEKTLDRLRARTRRGLTVLSTLAQIGELPSSLASTTRLNHVELRSGEDGPELLIAGYTRDFRSASRLYDWVTSRSAVLEQTSRKQSSVRREHRRVRFRARFSLRRKSRPAGRTSRASNP